MNNQPIGIFDSGMGGLTVVQTIHELLPTEDILYFGDSANNPYGTKTKEEITQLCIHICERLIQQGAKAIVIACNTATSAAVPLLRKRYSIPIIGMEPALKVACDDPEIKKAAVWATELTLKEKKFADLMERVQGTHEIVKVPCPELVTIIENDEIGNEEKVQKALDTYICESGTPDAIVLGCTHFVFYKEKLKKLLPDVKIIDGNMGTARHLATILAKNGQLNSNGGTIQWFNSDPARLPLEKVLYTRLEDSKK